MSTSLGPTKAAICCIGNELTSAKIADKNGYFLAHELNSLGFLVSEIIYVNDEIASIKEHLQRLSKKNQLMVLSGGLGPTDDDLTVDALADFLNCQVVFDEAARRKAELFFQKNYKKKLPAAEYTAFLEKSLRQTRLPQLATAVTNNFGLAPGIWVATELEHRSIFLIALPGFPDELQGLWPSMKTKLKEVQTIKTQIRYFNLWTIAESKAFHEIPYEKKLVEMGDRALDFGCQVYIKTQLKADPQEALKELERVCNFIETRYQPYIYEDPILDFINYLKKSSQTLATVESCTGGLAAKKITDIAGASSVYKGSIICYANEIKEKVLRLPRHILEEFGAVSRETAAYLSNNGRELLQTDYCLAFTGIAGPGGATSAKPLGLIYISIATRSKTETYEFHFNYGRDRFRHAAVIQGFVLLCQNFMKTVQV